MGTRLLSSLLTFILTFFVFLPTSHAESVELGTSLAMTSVEEWVPTQGDYVMVDLSTNTGYLASEDGRLLAPFDVVSGQKNIVNYIGLRYWAETPEHEWTVKQKFVKEDRVTFGQRGLFLRLYLDNKFTHYGIHAYKYADSLLSLDDDERYQSMGCILVSEDVLTIIEEVFEANEEEGMRVLTYRG